MTDRKEENTTNEDDSNGGAPNQISQRLSKVSKKYDIDGDGKLDDVELAMRKMDTDGRGHLSNEKVHKMMVEQIKLQQAVFSMKRVGLVLVGLVIVLALSTLGTSFVAAKLAQDMKASSTGDLVSTANGEILGTRARGSHIPVTLNSEFVGRRRRHLLGGSTAENRRLNADVIATVPAATVADAWTAYKNDGTTISVSWTINGDEVAGQVSGSGIGKSTTGIVTRYTGVHAEGEPKPSFSVECTATETMCNVYESTLKRVNLGSAANFAILSNAGVTTTGVTSVTGDIGASPIALTAVTGFGLTADSTGTYATSALVTGKVYAADLSPPTPIYMVTAVSDKTIAYLDAASRKLPDEVNRDGAVITGTFTTGLYKWTTAVTVKDSVTFDGSDTDIWIMQIPAAVTVEAGMSVILAGGAKAENIFWQVAGAVTVGTKAHLEGIFLVSTAMTFNSGSSLNGAALAGTAVSLDSATIVQSSV